MTRSCYQLAVINLVACLGLGLIWHSLRSRVTLETPAPTLLFEDVRGRYLAEISQDERRNGYWPVPEEIPEKVLAATLAAEDARYYEHGGVDGRAVLRALYQNVKNRCIVSGASTIPMQVARIQRPGRRSLVNKLSEAVVADGLVRKYGHDTVLRHYLLIAPYGNQNYGIVYAARRYFAKPLEDLTWAEAALLAALPKLPGRMNLYKFDGWHAATQRARYVLDRLWQLDAIDDREYTEAVMHLPQLRPSVKETRPPTCLHAILQIREYLESHPAAWNQPARRPIVRTSIDLDLQDDVSYMAWDAMQGFRRDGAGNLAVIVAERASGNIVAYLGSEDYYDEENKGAIDYAEVPRSSGSTLKPFIYGLGMEVKGYTAATLLTDTGLALDAHAGAYTFKNYDESYLGPILYRNALGNSRNIPAAQVLQAVGIDVAYRHFCDLGLVRVRENPARYGLGMSIGGLYVTLADLVRAYGVLANDGRSFQLQWFPGQRPAHHTQLIQSDIARQITLFLSDPMARLPSFSRMGSLEYPFPVAVKTGTSKGYRDAWCVAYSDTYIAGVWVGHPDNYPMKKRTGADSAAQLVHRIMEVLHPERMDGMSETALPPPPAYIARRICMLTGKLATDETQHVALEWFKPGTEPVEKCDVYRKVAIDARTGRPALPDCPVDLIRQKTYVALDERFAAWAKQSGLELPPVEMLDTTSLPGQAPPLRIAINEPPDGATLLPDPETPAALSTIPLHATVTPASPQVVWYVDGEPYEVVDYPYSTRWKLTPGHHTFQVKLPYAPVASSKVRVTVQ